MSSTESFAGQHPLGAATRCGQVGISVGDLDASARWYEEKLDGYVTATWESAGAKARGAFVTVGGFDFELVEIDGSQPFPYAGGDPVEVSAMQGLANIAFTVDSCDAASEELKRRGVRFVWEPTDLPQVARRGAVFCDVDGNLLQVVEHLGDR